MADFVVTKKYYVGNILLKNDSYVGFYLVSWPLKVQNPFCLWGRVVCGSGGNAETLEHYTNLHDKMNHFYHDATQDLHRLKPTSLEEGKVFKL